MTKVTKDAADGIMLDVASAKVWLDDFRDRDALFALLQEKIATSRRQHRTGDRHWKGDVGDSGAGE